jgi:hypothetical protein
MLNEPQLKPQAPGRWRGGQGKKRQERGDVAGQKRQGKKKGNKEAVGPTKKQCRGSKRKKNGSLRGALERRGSQEPRDVTVPGFCTLAAFRALRWCEC